MRIRKDYVDFKEYPDMKKITVVMPAYREKKEQISQAIESILNQTYTNIEYIIILDDPDNKELVDLLRIYESNDNRISLYINEKNLGCPCSKDRGIRLAQMLSDELLPA